MWFHLQIGDLSGVIVLDCSQRYIEDNMDIDAEQGIMLEQYKNKALPVLAYYDDQSKLHYVSSS